MTVRVPRATAQKRSLIGAMRASGRMCLAPTAPSRAAMRNMTGGTGRSSCAALTETASPSTRSSGCLAAAALALSISKSYASRRSCGDGTCGAITSSSTRSVSSMIVAAVQRCLRCASASQARCCSLLHLRCSPCTARSASASGELQSWARSIPEPSPPFALARLPSSHASRMSTALATAHRRRRSRNCNAPRRCTQRSPTLHTSRATMRHRWRRSARTPRSVRQWSATASRWWRSALAPTNRHGRRLASSASRRSGRWRTPHSRKLTAMCSSCRRRLLQLPLPRSPPAPPRCALCISSTSTSSMPSTVPASSQALALTMLCAAGRHRPLSQVWLLPVRRVV